MIVTAVTGAVAATLLSVGQASAATTYCGSGCDGQDPASYLVQGPGGPSNYYYCADDAVTIFSVPGDGGQPGVELRYSDRCATAWARSYGSEGATYEIQLRSFYANGSWRRTESTNTQPGSSWTLMDNDQGLLAEACVYEPYGGWLCTKAY